MAKFIFENGLKLRQKVRALVFDNSGHILLVRPHGYAAGEWTFAGGGVEPDEQPEVAMRRELAEELGLKNIERLSRLSVSNRFIYSAGYRIKRRVDHDGQNAIMFSCEVPTDAKLTLQAEELAEARWFTAEAAAEAFPVSKQRAIFLECISEIARSADIAAQRADKRAA